MKAEQHGPLNFLSEQAGREIGARAIMFHAAVAARLGLSVTDLKALELASREPGPLTAGQLAELTGLTAGAITGVIDRLERAGFVRRQADRSDRRRVIIEKVPGREREVHRLFESMGRSMAALAAGYKPQEMSIIVDFLQRTAEIMRRETIKLRDAASRNERRKSRGRGAGRQDVQPSAPRVAQLHVH